MNERKEKRQAILQRQRIMHERIIRNCIVTFMLLYLVLFLFSVFLTERLFSLETAFIINIVCYFLNWVILIFCFILYFIALPRIRKRDIDR